MKKKISIIVTAATLVALIIVGGTLAFFTDKGTVTNVITMGDVHIALTEPAFKDSGIVPGETISKVPTVKNIGSNDAYIRCKLNIVVPEAKNQDETLTREVQLLQGIAFGDADIGGSAAKWVLADDGYYYYQDKLTKDESVKFFHSVTVPEIWDNDFADKTFQINVTADAIQSSNFTPSKNTDGKIIGWNYSTAAGGGAIPIQSSPAIN